MTESLMKLYQVEWCPYCWRVRMKMTELELTYITINVPHDRAMRSELFSISGQNGIPTLIDGTTIIADDEDAIIAYLEGKLGKVSLLTSQRPGRIKGSCHNLSDSETNQRKRSSRRI